MRPSVTIHVVPVAHFCSLALAMRQKLSAAQLNELGKLRASGIKRQASVGGKANGTNTSAGLAVIGVWASVVQLAPMLRAEIVSKSGHGNLGSAMLLEKGDISTPLSKALSIRCEVGNVFGLDYGEASAWLSRGGGIRDRLDKLISFPLHR